MIGSVSSAAVSHFIQAVGSRLDGSPLAIMLDIDGTLAPIAPRPEAAGVPAETRDLLRRLAGARDVHVALISGRAVTDAWRMVGVPDTWIVGNHGLELRAPDGNVSAVEDARAYESAIAVASDALAFVTRAVPGAIVENKRWTLSLHYRQVDERDVPALLAHAHEVGARLGLRITEGKRVVELRPPVSVDKGTAALAFLPRIGIRDHTSSMLYAGDDQTDEDAFRALRQYGTMAVTVRIGSDADATPTSAEFLLESTEDLQRVLRWLVTRRE